jgi:hypothetical protein
MSRYIGVETLSYLHVDGNSYPVKDVREIPDETIGFEIDIKQGDTLDEVASRKSVYGDEGEFQTYRLFDANIIKLTEANFQLTNIKRLKIPI